MVVVECKGHDAARLQNVDHVHGLVSFDIYYAHYFVFLSPYYVIKLV
jgi:hypothetical protein